MPFYGSREEEAMELVNRDVTESVAELAQVVGITQEQY
jgi:hypothetical protein